MSSEGNEARYPLAFDSNGNPVKVPENAVAWRVRRGGGRRGRPRNVFDAETGRQLEIPLGASIDDLIDAGCPVDRYLLYPIDAEAKVIPGIIAVTEITEGVTDDEGAGPTVSQADPLVRELLASLKAANDSLCRALEATASGYGPVRPQPMPQQVYVEQPTPPKEEGGFKPEQMAQVAGIAKMVFDTIKGMGVGAAPPMGAAP
jgi:hypothetical protein